MISWGRSSDGKEVHLITLRSPTGAHAKVTTFGASLVALHAPDKEGHLADVVLGFDSAEGYQKQEAAHGATVGRFANRIKGGRFLLHGVEQTLPKNNGENCLHGGVGFHRRVWEIVSSKPDAVTLKYVAQDGEEGFPGHLVSTVEYVLSAPKGATAAGEGVVLSINYTAITTDKPTIVNLTNHSYFNLAGHVTEGPVVPLPEVLDHIATIAADEFTPTDAASIPHGTYNTVEGTPMDFRAPRRIGDGIDSDYEQIKFGNGYDHNWVFRPTSLLRPFPLDWLLWPLDLLTSLFWVPAPATSRDLGVVLTPEGAEKARDPDATLSLPATGRLMEVFTTEPGVQMYTGNFLAQGNPPKGKCRAGAYRRRTGICFETQHFPDTPNQEVKAKAEGLRPFPTTFLEPGQVFESHTVYWFSATK